MCRCGELKKNTNNKYTLTTVAANHFILYIHSYLNLTHSKLRTVLKNGHSSELLLFKHFRTFLILRTDSGSIMRVQSKNSLYSYSLVVNFESSTFLETRLLCTCLLCRKICLTFFHTGLLEALHIDFAFCWKLFNVNCLHPLSLIYG